MVLNKLSITALMPMKGQSERVPKKNLRDFAGKPLYHRVMNTLIESKLINNIIVNTDCEKIKKDIKENFNNNVFIRERKDHLIGNYISMNKIIEDDINNFNSEIYLQTHSTNPLISTKTIDEALTKMINNFKSNDFDSIFSVNKVQKRFYDKNCKPYNHDPKMLVTQHLEPLYEENSCLYIFTKNSFKKNNSRIGLNPMMFEMNNNESIDIDEIHDFNVAQILFESLNQ